MHKGVQTTTGLNKMAYQELEALIGLSNNKYKYIDIYICSIENISLALYASDDTPYASDDTPNVITEISYDEARLLRDFLIFALQD